MSELKVGRGRADHLRTLSSLRKPPTVGSVPGVSLKRVFSSPMELSLHSDVAALNKAHYSDSEGSENAAAVRSPKLELPREIRRSRVTATTKEEQRSGHYTKERKDEEEVSASILMSALSSALQSKFTRTADHSSSSLLDPSTTATKLSRPHSQRKLADSIKPPMKSHVVSINVGGSIFKCLRTTLMIERLDKSSPLLAVAMHSSSSRMAARSEDAKSSAPNLTVKKHDPSSSLHTRRLTFQRRKHRSFESLLEDVSSKSDVSSMYFKLRFDEDGLPFLDRNPLLFQVILDFLRSGHGVLKDPSLRDALVSELQFYKLHKLIKVTNLKSKRPILLESVVNNGRRKGRMTKKRMKKKQSRRRVKKSSKKTKTKPSSSEIASGMESGAVGSRLLTPSQKKRSQKNDALRAYLKNNSSRRRDSMTKGHHRSATDTSTAATISSVRILHQPLVSSADGIFDAMADRRSALPIVQSSPDVLLAEPETPQSSVLGLDDVLAPESPRTLLPKLHHSGVVSVDTCAAQAGDDETDDLGDSEDEEVTEDEEMEEDSSLMNDDDEYVLLTFNSSNGTESAAMAGALAQPAPIETSSKTGLSSSPTGMASALELTLPSSPAATMTSSADRRSKVVFRGSLAEMLIFVEEKGYVMREYQRGKRVVRLHIPVEQQNPALMMQWRKPLVFRFGV